MIKKEKKDMYNKYVSFGELNIIHGEISDNIFKPVKLRTQAVQWCLLPKNEKKIKMILKTYISRANLYSANLDDCFLYVLDYFYAEDRVFYKNYINNSNEYSIEKYVLSNLKNAFNIYKASILKKESYYMNTESENKINASGEEYIIYDHYRDKNVDLFFNKIDIGDELIFEFNKLKQKFIRFFNKNNYNLKFIDSIDIIILNLFLQPNSFDIKENLKTISKDTNISIESLNIFLNDIKQKYLNSDYLVLEIYENIKDILQIIA